MPLRLEIKRKLAQRSERVKSVDLHPTEPWILASLYSGTVCIWNYQTQTMVKSFEVTDLPVRSAKFISRKQWVVSGADDMINRVYNYNTMDKVKVFEAHTDYIRCVAVHPTLPCVLSSSDDMLIKLWDWEKGWLYTQIFEGHSHYNLKHNPNGRFVIVCGDGEYIIYTALAWRNRSFGSALEFVWSSEGEYAVRESTSKIKIFSKNFQEKKSICPAVPAEHMYGGTLLAICSNDFICFYDWAECRLIRRIDVVVKNLYWAESGDMVTIASDSSFFILKYNRDVVSAYLDSGRSVDDQGVEEAFELLYDIN